jgi:hypothetical protein
MKLIIQDESRPLLEAILQYVGRRQHVQETRSGISRHARFGGGYGLENHCYGARRWIRNYGKRRRTSATDTV